MNSDREAGVVEKSGLAAIVVMAVVAAVLVFLNLDGYQTEISDGHDFLGEPPAINWTHGWPLTAVIRGSIYPISGIYAAPNRFLGPHGVYSRWPFDQAPVFLVRPASLVLDCAFLVIVAAGSVYSTARLSARRPRRRTFSLQTLFLATTTLAILFGLASYMEFWPVADGSTKRVATATRTGYDYVLQLSAIVVAAVGVALTAYACVDLARRACRIGLCRLRFVRTANHPS